MHFNVEQSRFPIIKNKTNNIIVRNSHYYGSSTVVHLLFQVTVSFLGNNIQKTETGKKIKEQTVEHTYNSSDELIMKTSLNKQSSCSDAVLTLIKENGTARLHSTEKYNHINGYRMPSSGNAHAQTRTHAHIHTTHTLT